VACLGKDSVSGKLEAALGSQSRGFLAATLGARGSREGFGCPPEDKVGEEQEKKTIPRLSAQGSVIVIQSGTMEVKKRGS